MADASNVFNQRAKRVKKKYWWKDMKMKLIIGGAIATVLLIILICICAKFVPSDEGQVAVEHHEEPKPESENT